MAHYNDKLKADEATAVNDELIKSDEATAVSDKLIKIDEATAVDTAVNWIISDLKLVSDYYKRRPKETIMIYFTTKFPQLMLHVYTVMKGCEDEIIHKYYEHDYITDRVVKTIC